MLDSIREHIEKHPHGRGEEADLVLARFDEAETPPRAWGREVVDVRDHAEEGNTPTGVGKS